MSENLIEKTYAEQIAEKSKKKKLIISIVSLSLVLMISIMFIVMATVNIDLKPSVIKHPDRIYFNSKTSSQYIATTDEYKDFMEEYDKVFGISYLSALFSGRLGGYEIVEDKLVSKDLTEKLVNQNYVTFVYLNDKITLTNSNGKTYYSKYNSNYSIDFYEVTFALSNKNEIEDISMYLKYDLQDSSGDVTRYAEVKLKANTYGLYEIYNNIK